MVPTDARGHAMPPPCPSGFVDPLPPCMWNGYWKRSDGTEPTNTAAHVAFWDKPSGRWQERLHGYFLVKGALCYKHPDGMVYAARGVDEFPPTGC